jgi:hypothetical protein
MTKSLLKMFLPLPWPKWPMVRLMTTPSPLRTLWHAAADAAEEEDDEDDVTQNLLQ